MASITAWYNSQYSTWNRTRRLHTQPYLAREDTRTSRTATAMAQEAVVINMGDVANPEATTEKKSDTLFGPNIGIVSSGPEWADRHEKSVDELTPDIVKGWISKSKENNLSTTTLQALVNLKRPTLRLTPLEVSPSDDPDHADSQHHHGLEFEYDCDAPKCGISVHVLLSPKRRLADKPDASGLSKFLVFESVVDGGFGKTLKLEEGATLELGRFENRSDTVSEKDAGDPGADADAHATEPSTDSTAAGRPKKRFTDFNFRKRGHQRSIAGPAIAVLDAEAHAHSDEKAKDAKAEELDAGVRVTIRLAALDEEGKDMSSVNEQVTYLHVVRFGVPPPAIDGEAVEDNRPWVVKVVKREATIGPHTFHLHEIYGLSSNSSTSSSAPISPVPVDSHVYPPVNAPAAVPHEDEPSSECLVCLSSPREVVLLPCRHLVACRECAINMIEFGAGGAIVHQESETTATAGADGANGEGAAPEGGNPANAALGSEADAPQPVVQPRRKRKAKGWFCPVCRQPYTSLLRITTNPPLKDGKDEHRDSADLDDDTQFPTVPPTVATAGSPRAGLIPRGGFLRAFRPGASQGDVERGQV